MKDKLPAAVAAGTDNDVLTLDEQPVGRQQLDVENAAHVGGAMIVGAHHVGFVPQCVANEIALVVGVHVDLFLHLTDGGTQQGIAHRVNGGGCCRQPACHEKENGYSNNPLHFVLCNFNWLICTFTVL